MTVKSAPKRIGLFGGTFDPIHLGHLQIASQLKNELELDEMRLVIAASPPLRSAPGATAEQRWQMLKLAIRHFPGLLADDRELHRDGVSYSYDTVAEIREKVGEQAVIALCLGWDSAVSLPHWHRWQELIQICTLVVINRPHHEVGSASLHPALLERLQPAAKDVGLSAGSVVEVELEPLPISATRIRETISAGEGVPTDWLTAEVGDYIHTNKLYGLQ